MELCMKICKEVIKIQVERYQKAGGKNCYKDSLQWVAHPSTARIYKLSALSSANIPAQAFENNKKYTISVTEATFLLPFSLKILQTPLDNFTVINENQ